MRRYGWRRVGSPSMGVAFLALVVALGGSADAVTAVGPRSVGSKQLKRQSVTGAAIRANAVGARHLRKGAVTATRLGANAVNGGKVADGSLTGADVAESSLGVVPNASHAVSAETAGHAGTADTAVAAERASLADDAEHAGVASALDRVVYRTAAGDVDAAQDDTTPRIGSATARCASGQLVVGGGVKVDEGLRVADSYPDGPAAWSAHVINDDPSGSGSFTVYAACVTSRNVG
jgi:hypothetical protein